MLGEIVGEVILKPILEGVVQLIGYFTSRLILPLITLGYLSVAPAKKGVKVYPKWHGFNRTAKGRVVLHEEMGALLGMIFWALIGGVVFYIYSS